MADISYPATIAEAPKPGWSRTRQWRVLALIAAAVLAGVVIYRIILSLRPEPAAAAAATPGVLTVTPEQYAELKIQTVGSGSAGITTQVTGLIAVDENHSTPVLPPYSGQVTQIMAQPGQRVVANQPLLKIRAPEFVDGRNALFAAAAQRATVASQLRVVEANARRQEEIYKTAGGALKDFQASQNDLAVARSAVRTAEAALGAARDKLTILGKTPAEIDRLERVHEVDGIHAETTLHAPIGGVIASRAVALGQYLSAGGTAPAFVITDPRSVYLVAQVPESASAQVRLGDQVSVTTPAYAGRRFSARIDNIAAGLDPVTHRLQVRATVANPDLALKPQMFASFTIRATGPVNSGGVTVPASAVIHEGDSARVWVAGAGRVLQARTVRLGAASGGGVGDGTVQVVEGLQPGERVVTAGAIFVNEAGLPG